MNLIEEILHFWFEGIDDYTPINKGIAPFKKWFTKDLKFDEEIHVRFEEDLIKAKGGEYQAWQSSAKGSLALTILFDQFSRNMYRGLPKMYQADAMALEITLHAIKGALDTRLQLIERVFLYMPLIHSEVVAIQKLSLQFFGNLIVLSKAQNPKNTSYFKKTFEYAKRHHEIIVTFGRFPHRNILLNRASTKDELEFLKNPGSRL